ncbi:valine--tRNA ligase-like isoform X2 [Belonocnema kinseyi]|uniref:valine--tRNA ligase-like isoform X2 n=1 Tax=Belonocnema kinseyi TaxID=2817044 RepID=UPI00143D2D4B|nr:valine--tRNA ligase-like isoform X2 [Belonocnema kinseyi]
MRREIQRQTDFPDVFQPKASDHGWYNLWQEKEYFKAKKSSNKYFTMILPPPNITGTLHLGHALTTTIQDVIARWHRMKGDPVVWIPGLDHAGIATQTIVEKYLNKTKGIKRDDISKEEFLSYVWDWNHEKGSRINSQLKELGASLDWSKEHFTMSKKHSVAVTEAFVILNERNMLYREKDMINWSPSLRSGISDIEVEYLRLCEKTDIEVPGYKKKVTFGQIVEVAYKLKYSDEEIIIATTRPETICGDVAIAVNPNHTLYSRYIGQHVKHPLKDIFIPVIADDSVSLDFGTGAMKVTPAHDPVDYRIAKKHNLEVVNVIGEDGFMTEAAKPFQGLPRFLARDKIISELSQRGFLKTIKDHEMMVPRCTRTGDVIEYILREQWFLKCESMAKRAMEAVRNGSLKIDPSFHEDVWFSWLGNIRDWCVSRQLWWGHRIPAYRCNFENNSTWLAARSEEEALLLAKKLYGNTVQVEQDSDVLDTWFSSALLPFSSIGWPSQAVDFHKCYPLSLMVTGHDILFFWIARMTMLGLELTEQLPFKEVLLHGILCDTQGKKMSKSCGNVISPESVINGISLNNLNSLVKDSHNLGILSSSEVKRTISVNGKMFPNGILDCGADALRFTLCSHNIKNSIIFFDVDQCRTNKFFCNKILQACRYTLLMTNDDPIEIPKELSSLDRWILSRLSFMVDSVNEALTQKLFNKATSAIKQFIHYEFCDYFLEGTKVGFQSERSDLILAHRFALVKSLEVSLKILAPFTPFLSDEFYIKMARKLPDFSNYNSLMEASYPTYNELQEYRDLNLEERMKNVIEVILKIRSLLTGLSKKLSFEVHIVTDSPKEFDVYSEHINVINAVSRTQNIKIIPSSNYVRMKNSIYDEATNTCSIFLVVEDEEVLEDLKNKLRKRRLRLEKKVQSAMEIKSV